MSSSTGTTVWVDGHFIAGDIALDLANTVYRRWPDVGADLLTDTEALSAWLVSTNLLPVDREAGTVTPADLDDARTLRSLLWTVFDAQREGATIPSSALAGLLDSARRGVTLLTAHPDGSLTARDGQGAVAALALRAIALVLAPPPQGVRACDRCGWFFVDSSRGRRRRWCQMKTCGNQAKAARYRSSQP